MGFVDDKGTLVATRNIDKGEELFLKYGFRYWVHRSIEATSDSFTRLLIFIGLATALDDQDMITKLQVAMDQDEEAQRFLTFLGQAILPPGLNTKVLKYMYTRAHDDAKVVESSDIEVIDSSDVEVTDSSG